MWDIKSKPIVIFIVGPTAVGKTSLSLKLAESLESEIISIDSRLFYRGMNIGTAKPSKEELGRIPHHMIDIADPDETCSLGRFQTASMVLISEIFERGKVPICVGGTGQYVRALTEGWQVPPFRENSELRRVLRGWAEEIGRDGLYERLRVIDPKATEKIEPQNVRRTIRALEVIYLSGERYSEQRKQMELPYRPLQIGLTRPKEDLFERIDNRVDEMMAMGFLAEVETLLEKFPSELRSFSAIGYHELIKHLNGEMELDEAVSEIKKNTKKFVRKQYAWFKPGDENIIWYELGTDNILEEIEKDVRKILADDIL